MWLPAQLTLEQCCELAELNHPTLRRFDRIRQTETLTLDNIVRDRLPRIAFSAQASVQSDVPSCPRGFESLSAAAGMPPPRGMARDQYQLAATVEQNLYDGGDRTARRKEAQTSAELSRQQLAVELRELRLRVSHLYFGILLLDKQLEIHRLHGALLADNVRKAERLLQRGVATENDLLLLRAEQLTVGSVEQSVRLRREGLLHLLAHFVGRSPASMSSPVRPPLPEEGILLRPAREERLFDLRRSAVEVRRSQLRGTIRPRIGVFAKGWYGYPGLNLFDDMFSRSWSLNGQIGIRLSWNLSALYTFRSSMRRLDVELSETEIERDRFRFERSARFLKESADVERCRLRLNDDDGIIALRRSVREHTERRLESGVVDFNALVQDLTREHQALAERAVHEIEYLSAIYQLRHTSEHE